MKVHRKKSKDRDNSPTSSRSDGKTRNEANAAALRGQMNEVIEKSPKVAAQRRLVAQLQDARQFKASKVYAKNITGSYTDALNVVHPLNVAGPYLIFEYKSHPKGFVDYDSKVKAALKKNGAVPKNVADTYISLVSYQQYAESY